MQCVPFGIFISPLPRYSRILVSSILRQMKNSLTQFSISGEPLLLGSARIDAWFACYSSDLWPSLTCIVRNWFCKYVRPRATLTHGLLRYFRAVGPYSQDEHYTWSCDSAERHWPQKPALWHEIESNCGLLFTCMRTVHNFQGLDDGSEISLDVWSPSHLCFLMNCQPNNYSAPSPLKSLKALLREFYYFVCFTKNLPLPCISKNSQEII